MPAPRSEWPGGGVSGGTIRAGTDAAGSGSSGSDGGRDTFVATTVTEKKAPDLTINKIIAGAGAAATSAVFGSFFGAAGTVIGAALGSVVVTISTSLYARSLEKTSQVITRVKPVRRGGTAGSDTGSDTVGSDTAVAETPLAVPVDALATVPMRRGPDGVEPADRTMVAPSTPSSSSADARKPWFRRKRVMVPVVSTVVAFALAMVVITGIEWIKGSPLSGGTSGTSVGRVVTGGSAPETTTPSTGDTGGGSQSTASTATSTPAPGGVDATRTQAPSTSTTRAPTSSATPTTTGSPAGAGVGGVGGLLGGQTGTGTGG